MSNGPMGARVWTVLVLAALGVGAAGCERRDDAADAIYQSFSAGCGSVGQWSQAAQGQATSMRQLFTYLKDTDACRDMAPTLANLASTSEALANLSADPSFRNYRAAEERVSELQGELDHLVDLDRPEDTELRGQLATTLLAARLAYYDAKAQRQTSLDPGASQYASAMSAYHSTVTSLITESQGVATCLKQSPLAAAQLGVSLAALGGNFASPVIGAGMQVLAGVVNWGIQASRDKRYVDQLWKNYEAEMPHAISCALESMTQFYCQVDDAGRVLEEVSALPRVSKQRPTDPFLRVLDLLNYRLPVVLNWLERIRAGGASEDSFDADRRNQAWNKMAALETTRNQIEGMITAEERKGPTYSDPDAKLTAFRALILDLVSRLNSTTCTGNGTCAKGPFGSIAPSGFRLACYLLRGYPPAGCPDDPASGTTSESQQWLAYLSNPVFGPNLTFQSLRTGWRSVFDAVSTQVGREFSQTIVRDAQGLLVEAAVRSENNYSPVEILRMAKEYLVEIERRLPSLGNPQLGPKLATMRAGIDQAIALIANTANRRPKDCDSIPPTGPGSRPSDSVTPCDPSDTVPWPPRTKWRDSRRSSDWAWVRSSSRTSGST